GDLDGGINGYLGNMYSYKGPALWMVSFTHDPTVTDAEIATVVDKVIGDFLTTPPSPDELARAKVKAKSALYNAIANERGADLADLVGLAALFGDDPKSLNSLPE